MNSISQLYHLLSGWPLLVTVLLVMASPPASRADGVLLSWAAWTLEGVTEKNFEEAKKMTSEDILSENRIVTSWPQTYLLIIGAMEHGADTAFIKELIRQIADTTVTGLTKTKRLIIWERIITNEILFEGKGLHVEDDLFSVAGRANWFLRNMTGNNFGYIRINSSLHDRSALQQQWLAWLGGKEVEAYVNPYASDSGVTEISSLTALEAMIVSLRPNELKDQIARECAKKLYGLDEFPEDRSSPARLCHPDSYTPSWLAVLTGIRDYHDYDWWRTWWEEHHTQLVWNPQYGRFDIGESEE